MDDIQIYDDEAIRLQAAFEGFKQVYSTMHTPPQHVDTRQFWLSIKTFAIILGLIGAVIVSASHTVPVLVGVQSIMDIGFGIQFVIGVASFVMIEVMSIVLAYNAIETETASQELVNRVNRNMKRGKWFVVIIMVVFNVYYVLSSNGIALHDWIRITIFLFIGTSAPVVAFLTGEIWAIDKIKHNSKMKRENESYQTAYSEWESGLINSWNTQKKKWGGQVAIQVNSVNRSLNAPSEQYSLPHSVNHSVNGANEQAYSANTGYSKKMNARDIIKQWFEDNPDFVSSDDTVDDLHQKIMADTGQKVGRTSVYNVRKDMG